MFGRYTLERQAEYVVQAYRRAQMEWPWMGVVNLWYFKRATDLEQGQPMYYFRMVEPDFTPMPVYDAVRSYTHETPVLGLGLHQEDHWALKYGGEWSTGYADGAQMGSYVESSSGTVTLRWRGADLAARMQGPGTIAMSTDAAVEREYVVGDGWQEVRLAGRLADAEHDTVITVAGGTVRLDSLSAERRDRRLPLAGGLVGAVVVLAGALLLRRRLAAPAA